MPDVKALERLATRIIRRRMTARKPFRIGLGRGPMRNGLCAKGALFFIEDAYEHEGGIEIEVLDAEFKRTYHMLDPDFHKIEGLSTNTLAVALGLRSENSQGVETKATQGDSTNETPVSQPIDKPLIGGEKP
jgi:hypothetical protein